MRTVSSSCDIYESMCQIPSLVNPMLKYRYLKQYYHMLRSLVAAGKTNWASNVRLLMYKHGFGYMWKADIVGDASGFINLFRHRLADCFTQQ